jgi:hypothetical protein
MGKRTVLGIELKAIRVTLWKRTYFVCAQTEFKGGELINLAEEILRQPSIQAVARLLLAAFNQVYK